MAVHLKGHFCCTKPALIVMIKQGGGRIINISSGASLGAAGSSNYSCAKAGILGFTRSLAKEVGPQGIMVNAIFPLARTRMTERADQMLGAERTPGLGRGQTAEDVAPLIVYLASDRAKGINGQTFSLRHEGTIEIYSDPVMLRGIYSKNKWTADDIAEAMPGLLAEM
jgi:NAD(P)-dependent dehydrogenase (short-subunit alcohol dehydrogenase family)